MERTQTDPSPAFLRQPDMFADYRNDVGLFEDLLHQTVWYPTHQSPTGFIKRLRASICSSRFVEK